MNHKSPFLILLAVVTAIAASAQTYHTHVSDPNIKTLRLRLADTDRLARPILELNGSDALEISFDELSHEPHYYTYTVYHCNADWTLSNLNSNEYLGGFTTVDIDDYELSDNTMQIYTHYTFRLPNDDMQLKISGNYAVRIYEDNDQNKTVAWACFSVVEPCVSVTATVRGNTDVELNKRYQQLDFDLVPGTYNISDPFTELTVLVRQNGRTDNQVYLNKPTFVEANRLRYINNKQLIFEGGNEYRLFDLLSEYVLGTGVEKVNFDRTYYHALLYPSDIYTHSTYSSNNDANGLFVINCENAYDSDVEADYMWVHFRLPMKQPFFDGTMHVGGEFSHNIIDANSMMTYDNETEQYIYAKYLKQGGYNFQYWFLPKGSRTATLQRTEGSFWQTQNEYAIYVYHRPFGARYDKLICYSAFTSN